MSAKHVTVWVQPFKDRPFPLLQWHDPITNKRKSKSAGTADDKGVERARADLEYELNHGLHMEASSLSWERFRPLFEDEYVAGKRPNTQRKYRVTLDVFEAVCHPRTLRSVNERTLSAFEAGLRARKGFGGGTQKPSTIKVRLQ
jgi:hypothetical protein